ncbi:GWxTD domain-containing protein [candidate division KSB1 bacterium]|nr:GWxTD domain-containing protein [candidate division KSB1 bacterium]
MYYRIVILFIFCVLILNSGSIAQQAEEQDTPFRFSLDFTQFRYSDTLTYLEFSAALYRDILKYIPDGERFVGEFIVTSRILQNDVVIDSLKWRNINHVDSLAEVSGYQRVYCQNNFLVRPGEHKFYIQVSDPNSSKKAEATVPMTIQKFDTEKLTLSDVQFSSMIRKDSTTSLYTKNGFRITPNPSALYGIGLPILYSYFEIYNFAQVSTDSGMNYKVAYSIFNADGDKVKSMPVKVRKKPGNSAVEVNGINVVTLVSGPYILLVEVKDMESGQIASKQKKFFVYREDDYKEGGAVFAKKEVVDGKGSAGLDQDRYLTMSEKELDEEFDWTQYLTTSKERKTYNKLNLEGKRNYLLEFWAEKDPTIGTPENEFKRDYLERVQISNTRFRGAFREGWKTDRGRIMLLYGRPDEIERFPYSNESKGYEIWHYFSIQGGVVFIFVDRRNMGDFELVHSTARGELYDQEWTRWIDPNQ